MPETLVLDSARPMALLQQCPAYQPTPVQEIRTLNGQLLLIKNESNRFNLGAFKALGGIYAVTTFLLKRWQEEHHTELDPSLLFNKELQDWAGQFTFVCASAGNHGMAVAKGAQLVSAKSRIHLSDTVPDSFEEKLRALGAAVVRSGSTYEESMHSAKEECESNVNDNFILLADSSWPGYVELPTLVMEGYTVMAEELRQSFLGSGNWPTHVFLQAGVGGLAAAVAYHIRHHWKEQPQIIIVEPDAAPCLFESYKRGKLTTVDGPVSDMGRLDCKEPSMLAFESLRETADHFVCISESDAANAVSYLANNNIETTPSGAAGVAAVLDPAHLEIAVEENARCLAIVTEGLV